VAVLFETYSTMDEQKEDTLGLDDTEIEIDEEDFQPESSPEIEVWG